MDIARSCFKKEARGKLGVRLWSMGGGRRAPDAETFTSRLTWKMSKRQSDKTFFSCKASMETRNSKRTAKMKRDM